MARHTHYSPETDGEFILFNQARCDISPSVVILGCTLWSSLDLEYIDILSWSLSDSRRKTSQHYQVYPFVQGEPGMVEQIRPGNSTSRA
jgi:hypothetical protein